MATVSDIWKLVEIVGDADEGGPDQKLENTPKGKAMQDVVSEVLARPDLKDTNLASQKLGAAYFLIVTTILPQMSDRSGRVNNWSVDKKDEGKALTTPNPNAVYQKTIAGDFYTRLGISKDATVSEIDQAYKSWAKENHPDVLRSKNASSEDIARAEENAILMGEAYNTLKSPKLRPEYDKFWDKNFTGNTSNKESSTKNAPQLTEGEGSGFGYIGAGFTPNASHKNNEAVSKTADFRKTVSQGGAFSVGNDTVEYLDKRGLIPEGFNKNQITNAFELYSRGATSEGMVLAVENSGFLSESEVTSLSNTAFFMKFYEEAGLEGIPSQSDLFEANGQPTFSLGPETKSGTSSQAHISFDRNSENLLSPILDKATGLATDKAQDLAVKGLKSGASKILKKGVEETAVKAGAKLAGGASVKAAIWAVMGSLGLVGGPATEAIAAFLTFIATELIPLILGLVKKLFDPETIAKILMVGGLFAAGLGMTGLGFSSLGVGAFSYFRGRGPGSFVRGFNGIFSSLGVAAGAAIGVVFASLAWPVVIAFIAVPLSIALVLFIINSGAYIVPPSETSATSFVENAYMQVEKRIAPSDLTKCNSTENTSSYIECDNSDLPTTIVYTVTITAKRGPLIDVIISDDCRVERDATGPPNCPPAENISTGAGIAPGAFPFSPPGNSVSPTESFTFTYTRNFDPPLTYFDALVFDTVNVRATSTDGSSESVLSSASMCIGNCPQDCPSGWPVGDPTKRYLVPQGPFTTHTHAGREAIDVQILDKRAVTSGDTVISTHYGTVASAGVDGWGGLYVDIYGNCAGIEFRSRHVHFSSMDNQLIKGATVVKGQVLGIMGDTGAAYLPHDHYEFRARDDGGSGAASPRPALQMIRPFIPKTAPRGCLGNCNILIPPD